MASGDSRFDKRIIGRSLRSGAVSEDEYEKYLSKLKDLSGEAAVCESELMHISRKIPSRVMNEDDEL
jgi:hypothetical protein